MTRACRTNPSWPTGSAAQGRTRRALFAKGGVPSFESSEDVVRAFHHPGRLDGNAAEFATRFYG
ncbi:MAG: hypothetical protein SGJ17_02515 [Hyphomicrobiales bacterium]|nr:hypothetical protein [Hyphomicrobiales bacterium]